MIRKMKSSPAVKICVLAGILFLAVSAVLYGVIFKILPVYYGSQLAGGSGSGSLVSAIILNEQGDILWPDINTAARENISVSYVNAAEGEDYVRKLTGMEDRRKKGARKEKHRKGAAEGNRKVSAAEYEGGISVPEREQKELLIIYGGRQTVEQAVELLHRMFPWILGVFAAATVIFALATYLYAAAPVKYLNLLSAGLSCRLTELRRTNEELQRENEKLKSDLEREKETEKERLTFYSVVSHELKTPLTILKAHLCGMLLGIGEYQRRDYYLKRSQEAVDRMEIMVQELLTLSRLEHHTFTVQPTDLALLLRQQIWDMKELMMEKGQETAVDMPEHLIAEVNGTMMGEVFSNLLMNAVRYTPENQGNQIRVTLRRDPSEQREIRCSVENTGVFIPEEVLPRLFEAFYRGNQTCGSQKGGSGLGLYIVKTILDQHGARYRIENTKEGVRFSFWLQDTAVN